jgi:hypothetical protein
LVAKITPNGLVAKITQGGPVTRIIPGDKKLPPKNIFRSHVPFNISKNKKKRKKERKRDV